ncbi:hypothetical protein GQ457_18G002270 [Hibiscus cannabinus]
MPYCGYFAIDTLEPAMEEFNVVMSLQFVKVENRVPRGRVPIMDVITSYDAERDGSRIQHDLWPLDEMDPKNAKFPCCLVWTPLPVVSWLAPFIGHVGICREAGAILDFSGSYFVNIEDFAFGAVARYVQLNREKCCFPPNLAGHACKQGYRHTEYGTALTWDDALQSSVRYFEHKSYNLFSGALPRVSTGGMAVRGRTFLVLPPPPHLVSVGDLLCQNLTGKLELSPSK